MKGGELGLVMELEEGKVKDKAKSFSSSRDVITYKRRKRVKSSVSPVEQIVNCYGNSENREQVRIVHNWRYVLEQLAQSDIVEDNPAIVSCIQTALSCAPLGFSNKSNIKDSHFKDRQKEHKKLCIDESEQCSSPMGSLINAEEHKELSSDGLENPDTDQMNISRITIPCQNVFFDILISQKFALLCDLQCEYFGSKKIAFIAEFNLIISKMKDGVYNQSLDLLARDIQQVWKKFQMIGREISLLADDLSDISKKSSMNQGDAHAVVIEDNSMDLTSKLQPTSSCKSICLTKLKQNGGLHPFKDATCKQCGFAAYEKDSLICDTCETVYHVSCIKPAVQKNPTRSWYCTACLNKSGSVEPDLTSKQRDSIHQNCRTCQRLENSGCPELVNENPESVLPVVSPEVHMTLCLESEDSRKPSKTAANVPLCRQCQTCEEEDKRFLICSHVHCPNKYYHIRCLKSSQIASQHQQSNQWYCPSCLCRACLVDTNDELICMCDCCDDAYHIYCMKPPLDTIPEGMWYCSNCETGGERKPESK